ncbi:MAG TPA: HAD-IIIC family phosphatase [Tepidisphaeraceae bacterium]|jgi:FkbH-like protein|nr:HAD-IIIC family phosphatase [Tepidisphaeraceae bacterium]
MEEVTRDQIDRAIGDKDISAARRALARFWRQSPNVAAAGFVVSRFETLRPHIALTPCKIAILRSFTVEPAVPLLRATAFIGGVDLNVRVGDFDTYVQDVLNPASWLYAFSPDVAILAVQSRDVAPALWEGFADLDRAAVSGAVEQTVERFRQVVEAFRQKSPAHLIIHGLQIPPTPAEGLLDRRSDWGQAASFARINHGLFDLARSARNIYVLDYDGLIAGRGRAAWYDHRKWVVARMPIAAGELIYLAREWMRFVYPIVGRVCKVLAVDLDNTLWGGVIGEDGIDGIQLDQGYPGDAYRSLQRAILDLYRRGIVLAVCSKNNPAEAMEAIADHPGMLLRPEHFAIIRTNWADKATNLREIAAELNVGIDSIAFLDDNFVEREWISEQIPEATVIDLPGDPMLFAQALRECPFFERLELTDEDKARGRLYAERRMRTELEATATSLEDFYRSLRMKAIIEPVNAKTLSRAAQLTQKTNQFNLTTRRYSERQLDQRLAAPDWRAFTVQVADRFGDNGIIGLAILRIQDGVCEIDTLLLSCRVIGRTIETALLAALAREAIRDGATKLVGWFVPTKKNAPARDFYKSHHFVAVQEREGATLWELDLVANSIASPQWVDVKEPAHE